MTAGSLLVRLSLCDLPSQSAPDIVVNMRYALLRVGDAKALEDVIAFDGKLPSGCYRRAWSLVNVTELTYRSCVAELAGGT